MAFDAAASHDPDGGELKFAWDFGDGKKADGVKATHSFHHGGHLAGDAHRHRCAGVQATAAVTIAAGNEAPQVKFTEPLDGGFVEGKQIAWKVSANDAEDGAIAAGSTAHPDGET